MTETDWCWSSLAQLFQELIANPNDLLDLLQAQNNILSVATGHDDVCMRLRAIALAYELQQVTERIGSTTNLLVCDLSNPEMQVVVSEVLVLARTWRVVSEAAVHFVALVEQEISSSSLSVDESAFKVDGLVSMNTENPFSAPVEGVITRREHTTSPSTRAISQSSKNKLTPRTKLNSQARDFLFGWLVAHKDNPYPNLQERQEIARQVSLTELQVRNWFANVRKRRWKKSRCSTRKAQTLLDLVLRRTS